MFRTILLTLLTIAVAEKACEGDQCAAPDRATAGSVMLQVQSAKSVANLADKEPTAEEEADLKDLDDEKTETDEDETSEEDDSETEMDEESEAEEMEDEDVESDEAVEEASLLETGALGRGGKRGGKRGRSGPKPTDEDAAACPSGGRLVDGKCWHVSLPATSCEETCVEKDLQYDEATELGPELTKENKDELWGKCLGVAAKFGYVGKTEKRLQWGQKGCGCVVYKVPAYGTSDTVRLNVGKTDAQCQSRSAITGRLCSCKKAAAVGESCASSSNCAKSYCKSGTCTSLLSPSSECTDHASCTTGYCSPTESTCGTLAWKPTLGAYTLRYHQSGQKRSKPMKPVPPHWEDMTTFPSGFCLSNDVKRTGCMIAKGIDQKKTIAKAKARCAQSAQCRAVWCCATGCPASTCYATKAEAPNYKKKDCPDAPGSFRESKLANTFFAKDAPAPPPEKDAPPVKDVAPVKDKEDEAEKEPDDEKESEEKEEESSAKMYKLVKSKSACSFGRGRGNRYKRLKGEKTLDDCAEAVKQHEGLAFGWMERKKICVMAPKPWAECPKFRKGPWELYELDLGDELEQE